MDMVMGLRRAGRLFGDCPAVVDGDTRFTWEEFDIRTRKLAAALRDLGLGRGDRVAVLMINGYRYLELYYAVARLGGVLVPLNTRLAPPEITYMLEDSGARALVVDDLCAPLVGQLGGDLHDVGHVIHAGAAATPVGTAGYEDLLEGALLWNDAADVEPHEDDIFGLFYTGGTTGKAKGVMLSHRNLLANALHVAIHAQLQQGDTYLHVAPMFHIADACGICLTTMLGGCHVILPGFNGPAVLETIQRERVTYCTLVPTMINALVQLPSIADYDLSSWRLLIYGSSPIAPEVLRRAQALLPCELAQAYGQTEAGPVLTWLSADDHQAIRRAASDSPWASRAMSCGRSIVDVEMRVVDEEDRDVAPGEIGEVIARGPNVMKGYWNRPQETAAALRDGWLRTGDLARLDTEQYLYIVDRKKDMIISGAENIYSVEVEAVLFAHPAVLEAAVIGLPDPTWGERVHAVVALKPGHAATADDLVACCRARIAGYKVPRSFTFVDALPKSGAGKVLKRELRAAHWEAESRLVH